MSTSPNSSLQCLTTLQRAESEVSTSFIYARVSRTTSEYALDFRMVAASTGWNDQVLLMVKRSSLQASVQTGLACSDEDLMLDQLIAMGLDNLLRACRRPSWGFGSLPGTSSETELMEVSMTHLPPRNVNAAINRVSAPTAGSQTPPGTHVQEGEPGVEATGRGVLLHLHR